MPDQKVEQLIQRSQSFGSQFHQRILQQDTGWLRRALDQLFSFRRQEEPDDPGWLGGLCGLAYCRRVDDVEGTAGAAIGNFVVGPGTGGKVWSAAYAYDLSKRTQAYVAYSSMKNDSNTAGFDKGISDATLGGKQTFMGIGLRHRF